MIAKTLERKKAIDLRISGHSYSEILKEVSVSQSTLSLWLKDIVLSKEHIKSIAIKRKLGQIKGATKRKDERMRTEKKIFEEASSDIKSISNKELFLSGIIAYWCEGAKQKKNNVSQGVIFSNSDPFLIKLFLKWLKEICYVPNENILYNLCIHEKANQNRALAYWSKTLNLPIGRFGKTILKKHNSRTVRKNIGKNYYGLLRIAVKKSTNLNRRIAGWVKGIDKHI